MKFKPQLRIEEGFLRPRAEVQAAIGREANVKSFILYGTSACHLCELAQAMLEVQHASSSDFAWKEVDISESDALFERYGLSIPVVKHPDSRELKWPFSADQLQLFLAS